MIDPSHVVRYAAGLGCEACLNRTGRTKPFPKVGSRKGFREGVLAVLSLKNDGFGDRRRWGMGAYKNKLQNEEA
jgi:hypothetical protein